MIYGAIESFHAGLEKDRLRIQVFNSFSEAEAHLAWAREDCSAVEPKQSLGG